MLSVDAVVEAWTFAVRPPVFDRDRGSGRYYVYEICVRRWEEAGRTRGEKLRTILVGITSELGMEEERVVKCKKSGVARIITKAGGFFRSC